MSVEIRCCRGAYEVEVPNEARRNPLARERRDVVRAADREHSAGAHERERVRLVDRNVLLGRAEKHRRLRAEGTRVPNSMEK